MDMKRSYYEDVRIFSSTTKTIWFVVLFLCLIAISALLPNYRLNDVNYIAINIIVAVGLNILVGYTGQVSLGHAGFFAIGSYTTVLLLKTMPSLPFPFALVAGGLIAALFGFILGIPSLRLEGPYLAIATLGFGMAITQVLGRFSFFGGRNGLEVGQIGVIKGLLIDHVGLSPAEAGSLDLYLIIMVIMIALTWAARNIMKTRVGRAFIAIRDDDIAAEAMGVNITYYKTLAFAISAFYTGIAGGLYAFWLGYINPESFDFILSVLFLSMVVVGGVGSITGSILGAIVISFMNLNLTKDSIATIPLLGNALTYVTEHWMDPNGIAFVSIIVYGIILIVTVIFEPLGLFGFWIRIKKYWKTWPF